MEALKHECGIAMVRLLKPLEYYQQKYGTWMFGLNKLYLMMEKQHNRGQEGAGMACVNLDALPGSEYMFRERAEGSNAITEIFGNVQKNFKDLTPKQLADTDFAKRELPLPVSCIWVISVILQQAKVGFRMFIRFCVGIIGGRRTCVCVVISI